MVGFNMSSVEPSHYTLNQLHISLSLKIIKSNPLEP